MEQKWRASRHSSRNFPELFAFFFFFFFFNFTSDSECGSARALRSALSANTLWRTQRPVSGSNRTRFTKEWSIASCAALLISLFHGITRNRRWQEYPNFHNFDTRTATTWLDFAGRANLQGEHSDILVRSRVISISQDTYFYTGIVRLNMGLYGQSFDAYLWRTLEDCPCPTE